MSYIYISKTDQEVQDLRDKAKKYAEKGGDYLESQETK